MNKPRHGPGRPTKYGRPSRAVTLTLPEDVLARLAKLDADLGRAVVMLVERLGNTRARALRTAELAEYGNQAVILVNPAKALKRLPGVKLIPTGNGRALISLDHPNAISQLELDVRDSSEAADISEWERQTLAAIADILRQARHSPDISLKERSIIVLESKRHRRRA